ncbi:hypothetical protein [Stutzerimonas nitrititolerans]|uniref:hypothetical protein n=1 Tax=Stutzerimonas nitrititolerans TaxID=2482751 RepID=UPI0028AFDFF9|nr:hypothetical protein [Stutzerimonas nitrititolerans]
MDRTNKYRREDGCYPTGHPFTLAITAFVMVLMDKGSRFAVLSQLAKQEGIDIGSGVFDEAAELLGVPYCDKLDLYVPRAVRDKAERLPRHQIASAFA